ncbi:MAG: nitroreductase family protein [Dehalococcoidia bacterium]|nr:nitroreductase family protein [Dehalococcoidia bacterium]
MPELLPALANRRASRAFSSRPVEDELQHVLWMAVSVAPSHGNTQPTRILVAHTPESRAALISSLSEGNRNWAPAAPLLFAIAAVPSHDTTPQDFGGTTREVWAMHAGIAIGNLMAQATALGLIAHPMAGFDEPGVRAVFGAPDDVRILAVVAAGYPGDPASLPEDLARKETAPQDRLALEHLVAFDRWGAVNAVSARELRRRNR